MSRITLHGFYGMGNLGDEAILQILRQELRVFPDIRIVVFSHIPQEVSRIHEVPSILASSGKLNLLRNIWAIITSQLFVLGGGGLLKDYGQNADDLKYWVSFLRVAQRLHTKTALFAIGVENIRYAKSKYLLKETLDKVDFISVRDRESQTILQEIGIQKDIIVTTDPAVLLGTPHIKTEGDITPPKIIICLRHWFNKGHYIESPGKNIQMLETVAEAADYLISQYSATIDFVSLSSTSGDDDSEVAKQALSLMKYKEKAFIQDSTSTVDTFLDMLPQYTLLIGMRLHSLILATAFGIPVIGLEYMPKVRAYMESIRQRTYSLPLEDLTSDQLKTCIDKTFRQYESRSRAICAQITRLQHIARKNIDILVSLARGTEKRRNHELI